MRLYRIHKSNYMKKINRKYYFSHFIRVHDMQLLLFSREEEEEGLGARVTVIIQNVANFASSMLVSFIQNWQLTLMMLAAGPIMASVMYYMNKV